jgi:hypothetical protein
MPIILGDNGLFSEPPGSFDKLGVTSSSLVSPTKDKSIAERNLTYLPVSGSAASRPLIPP